MRLSDFKDDKAITVVAKLLKPIGNIARNEQARKAAENGTQLDLAAAILENNPQDIRTMLAILDDKDPETYHCNAATVFSDVFNMISDPALMELFGLQRQTAASSGSASETIEAPEK